jgi:hypothetical protein
MSFNRFADRTQRQIKLSFPITSGAISFTLRICRTCFENSQLAESSFDDITDPANPYSKGDCLWHLNFVSHIFHGTREVLLAKIGIVMLDTDYLFLKIDINVFDSCHGFQFLFDCIRTGFTLHIFDLEFHFFHDLLPPNERNSDEKKHLLYWGSKLALSHTS